MDAPLCPYCKVPGVITGDYMYVCPKCGTVLRPMYSTELEEVPTVSQTSLEKEDRPERLSPKIFSVDYSDHKRYYSEEIYYTKCLDRWKHHKRASSYCAIGARVLALIDKGMKRSRAVAETIKLYPWWTQAGVEHALKMVLASIIYPPKDVD